jgi:hypothetical protein
MAFGCVAEVARSIADFANDGELSAFFCEQPASAIAARTAQVQSSTVREETRAESLI